MLNLHLWLANGELTSLEIYGFNQFIGLRFL